MGGLFRQRTGQRDATLAEGDGQRLVLTGNDQDQPAPTPTTKPATHGRHYGNKHAAAAPKDEPAPKKPEPSTLSLIFGR